MPDMTYDESLAYGWLRDKWKNETPPSPEVFLEAVQQSGSYNRKGLSKLVDDMLKGEWPKRRT